jgi:hypothetical protein
MNVDACVQCIVTKANWVAGGMENLILGAAGAGISYVVRFCFVSAFLFCMSPFCVRIGPTSVWFFCFLHFCRMCVLWFAVAAFSAQLYLFCVCVCVCVCVCLFVFFNSLCRWWTMKTC